MTTAAVVKQPDTPVSEVEAVPEPQTPPPTKEEVVAKINKNIDEQMAAQIRARRLAIARRGYRVQITNEDPTSPYFGKKKWVTQQLHPSLEPSDEELKAMVPLPEDNFRFAKYPEGHPQAGQDRIAYNKHGLYASTKQPGRKHRHMTKRNQALKSATLRIFKKLFEQALVDLRAKAAKDGTEFKGVPQEYISQIGTRATKLAAQEVLASIKARARFNRRQQDALQKVAAGLLNGNQINSFIKRGGEYGR